MYKSFNDTALTNKRVFIRMDYNVPIQNGIVTDDYKIYSSFSTIEDVIAKNPRSVIIGTHVGRPGGKIDDRFTCRPIYDVLKNMVRDRLSQDIGFCSIDNFVEQKMVFLENLRFYDEEENMDSESNALSLFFTQAVDVVIIDAFGVLHRHAYSTTGNTLPKYAGNLVMKEVQVGNTILKERIDLLILGGSKVKDKIPIFKSLLPSCKNVIIIGAMANTFICIKVGIDVGKSVVEEDARDDINTIYDLAYKHNVNIHVPQDFVVKVNNAALHTNKVPYNGKILDIGHQSISIFDSIIQDSTNIFWNGPAGVFEEEEYCNGTKQIAHILSNHFDKGKVIIGGGETAASVRQFSDAGKFYHVSTGGGAFLKFLSKTCMPGLELIKEQQPID